MNTKGAKEGALSITVGGKTKHQKREKIGGNKLLI